MVGGGRQADGAGAVGWQRLAARHHETVGLDTGAGAGAGHGKEDGRMDGRARGSAERMRVPVRVAGGGHG